MYPGIGSSTLLNNGQGGRGRLQTSRPANPEPTATDNTAYVEYLLCVSDAMLQITNRLIFKVGTNKLNKCGRL